jgi:hypothetical protein
MKSPESYEKAAICEYLAIGLSSNYYFKPYMAGFGKSGVPDIVGVNRHRGFFAIEVKRPGKEPTPIQERRMSDIRAAGGKTFWGTAEKVIREFEVWIS